MEASSGATKLDFNNFLFRFPETLNGSGLSSAKETYHFKEPTNRNHPISCFNSNDDRVSLEVGDIQ